MPRAKKTAKQKKKKRSGLAEKVNRVLRNQSLVKAGERVGVAVSGGADSVALLRLLLELRTELGIVPIVLHFNHQLRGRASDADEKFVRKLAEQHDLEFIAGREDVASRRNRERGNLEDVGRRARHAFFEKLQSEGQVTRVAVAHTADDQAETVLAHVLRGTGLSGLRGIHPETLVVFRPLLEVRRRELRTYLKSLKQTWREDATNRDTKRTRAHIRQKLLPLLEKDFNSGVVEHLCQLGELAGEAENYLEARAAEWISESARQTNNNEIAIDLAELRRAPVALQTRILRAAVAGIKTRGGQLSKEHVDAALQLALKQDSGKTLPLPGGVLAQREREVLRFKAIRPGQKSRENPGLTDYAYKIDLQGGRAELRLVELSCVLHFREIDWPAEGGETIEIGTGAVLDLDRLGQPLVLRAWKPGDAMRPRGHQKAHSLARLLNEKSISRWEKQKWPVLVSGEKVVWSRGLAEAEECAPGPETRRAVLISEEPLL